MEAGKLKHRVTIQQPTLTVNAYGDNMESWGTVASVWASIATPRGSEGSASDRQVQRLYRRVRIRHRDGVTASMRIVWGSVTLNIDAVRPDPDDTRYLDIDCTEDAA